MITKNKLRISRGADRERKKQRKAYVEGVIVLIVLLFGVMVLLYPSRVN